MTLSSCLFAVALAALSAQGHAAKGPSRDPRALEVLRRAERALGRARVLEYDFEYLGTDTARAWVSGHAIVDRRDPSRPRYRARVRIGLGDGYDGHPQDFEIAADGANVWRLDREARRLEVAGRESGSFLVSRTLGFAVMPQLLRDPPFRAEIEGPERTALVGTTRLDGLACDVVFLSFPPESGLGDQFFFFGRQDGLPRRLIMATAGPAPGSVFHFELRLSGLRPIGSPAAADFRIAPPPGYAVVRVDERAAPGGIAPDFTLKDAAGEPVRLADLRGRVVVLDFWATWCPFCRALHPGLDALRRELADEPVSVLAINIWESGDPRAYLSEHGYGFRALLGGDAVADLYRVGSTPTAIVIGPEGRIRHRETEADPAARDAALRRVIGEIRAGR